MYTDAVYIEESDRGRENNETEVMDDSWVIAWNRTSHTKYATLKYFGLNIEIEPFGSVTEENMDSVATCEKLMHTAIHEVTHNYVYQHNEDFASKLQNIAVCVSDMRVVTHDEEEYSGIDILHKLNKLIIIDKKPVAADPYTQLHSFDYKPKMSRRDLKRRKTTNQE